MVDVQREKNIRFVEAINHYFADLEENKKVNQECPIAANDVPVMNRHRVDKECGCCVGAHLAYFFAKNPEFGIDVKPWLFRDNNTGHYDEFFNGLTMFADRHNDVIEGFMEFYTGNSTVEDWYDNHTIEERLGEYDTDEDCENDDYWDACQEMVIEAVSYEADEAADGSPDTAKWFDYMHEHNGNEEMTHEYGDIYFYIDGADALTKYIMENTSEYAENDFEAVSRVVAHELQRHGASDRPWSAFRWNTDSNVVLTDALENLLGVEYKQAA